ncbi:hypothetical protein [Sphingobacterium thalpophilum]|uniref:hypothetical protein n=1 Tax=Sphingobacterium thalpophilum TaxID=259 RepID=UPI002D79A8EC|nr:hypothetical protein [Sphingobacterium thalpophilum]
MQDADLSGVFKERPVDPASLGRVVGRTVTDVTVAFQFPDALVVGGYGRDLRIAHQCLAGNIERVGITAPLPADEQGGEQADVGRHQPVVRPEFPEPVA